MAHNRPGQLATRFPAVWGRITGMEESPYCNDQTEVSHRLDTSTGKEFQQSVNLPLRTADLALPQDRSKILSIQKAVVFKTAFPLEPRQLFVKEIEMFIYRG